jgi:hypothetical protein
MAGAMAGNIFMPQKRLEYAALTAVGEPDTSLNLSREANIENALKAVTQSEAALAGTGMDPEALFSWADIMRRTILLKSYKAAKAAYELELLKVQSNPTEREKFLRAQDNYQKVKTIIETAFPPTNPDNIEVLTPQATQQQPAHKKT